MSNNVKPGDLAIIKGSARNDGLIVEVLKLSSITGLTGPQWLVKSVGGAVKWYPMNRDGIMDTPFIGPIAYVCDSLLRPLPGDTETEETKEEMVV